MRFFKLLLYLTIFLHPAVSIAQRLEMLQSGTSISIRGLSVVNDKIIWASGISGTVGKSTDGGQSWKWTQVKGFEKADFRDIEAFDETSAIIMAVASPAYILKTNDGGSSWKVVFEDKREKMFLDAMSFWNEQKGIVIGDPIDGRFFLARTFDGGDTWQALPDDQCPQAKQGEALFAASGTNIRPFAPQEACFVTGGAVSRIFLNNKTVTLPIVQGKETTGANSVAVYSKKKLTRVERMVVVGGDFAADSIATDNCAISSDGGQTWQLPITAPRGYRSCVEYISQKKLIACGTTGVDISEDGGLNWNLISNTSFHVCKKAKKGKTVFLAGKNGNIARLK